MATTTAWETAFDMIGLAAYLTLMTGEVPDRKLLSAAHIGSGLRLMEAARESAPAPGKRTRRRSHTAAA